MSEVVDTQKHSLKNLIIPYYVNIDNMYIYCSISVPGDYFCALDASGRRYDMDQRPELSRGSVEFVAPTEYMVRPPMPPIYFFLIDVSVSAVQSGLLEVMVINLHYDIFDFQLHNFLPFMVTVASVSQLANILVKLINLKCF